MKISFRLMKIIKMIYNINLILNQKIKTINIIKRYLAQFRIMIGLTYYTRIKSYFILDYHWNLLIYYNKF